MEFRKFARRLRERRRKEGRIKQVAREVAKSPALIITEELGKNPQEEMIGVEKKKVRKRELRHRVKQTPFKKLIRAVEDKAREAGSVVVYVSPYRNSKVCPIHFAKLEDAGKRNEPSTWQPPLFPNGRRGYSIPHGCRRRIGTGPAGSASLDLQVVLTVPAQV